MSTPKPPVNTPTIYLCDFSKVKPGLPALYIKALQKFIDDLFVPVWGTPCVLKLSKVAVKGAWNMVFVDTADVANALGYHDYYHGQPLAKIFVETTLDDGQDVCVTASHELVEMLVDPTAAIAVKGPNGYQYAYETADPCEQQTFKVLGLNMTDFITPQWFENIKHPAGTKYDYLGLIKKPFQLLSGGYAAVEKNGQWTQIFGSKAKASRFAKEDRRGHRIEDLR